jgi:hypothetical protein
VAVAFVRDYEGSTEGPTTLTITGVDASGTDYLIVGVSFRDGGSVAITGITHNGTALTAITSKLAATANNVSIQVWRLIAPSGSGDVVISTSGSPGSIQAGVSLFSGAHATVPEGTIVQSNSAVLVGSTSTGAATGDANGMFFDCVGIRNDQTLTPGATQTERSEQSAAGSVAGATSTAPGAASDTLDWSFGANARYAHFVVPILPAGGGGRAAKNDRAFPLGMEVGIARWMH